MDYHVIKIANDIFISIDVTSKPVFLLMLIYEKNLLNFSVKILVHLETFEYHRLLSMYDLVFCLPKKKSL